MIVPQYWAEGRARHRDASRQITVRRFGWSDVSQADAQAHADRRALDALQRLLSGEKLSRRDPRIPYNGAEGVPIREEILARHGETIITRNSYGARCLNTPSLLLADIDFQFDPSVKLRLVTAAILVTGALGGWFAGLWAGVFILPAIGLALMSWPSKLLHRVINAAQGGVEQSALHRVRKFVRQHPDWSLRIYRTPAGLRLLATNRTFSPNEPMVAGSFAALGVDPVYTRMCLNQHCFRARLTAKPWRIGIESHMRPRPGVWPVSPERLPIRAAWIERYENAAKSYAACTFVETIGSGVVHPDVRRVVELHDELCRATGSLPIA